MKLHLKAKAKIWGWDQSFSRPKPRLQGTDHSAPTPQYSVMPYSCSALLARFLGRFARMLWLVHGKYITFNEDLIGSEAQFPALSVTLYYINMIQILWHSGACWCCRQMKRIWEPSVMESKVVNEDDMLHDACGVFGCVSATPWPNAVIDVAGDVIYPALANLQHRCVDDHWLSAWLSTFPLSIIM